MFPHQTPRYPNIPGRTCVIWYQSKCQLISVSLIERLKGYNKASVSLSRLLLRFTPVVQYFAAFSSQAAFFFLSLQIQHLESVLSSKEESLRQVQEAHEQTVTKVSTSKIKFPLNYYTSENLTSCLKPSPALLCY